MVKSKTTGEVFDDSLGSPPPVKKRGQSSRGRPAARGRGRGSLPGSPFVAPEEEIALNAIPSTGPAIGLPLQVDGERRTTRRDSSEEEGAVGGVSPTNSANVDLGMCEMIQDLLVNEINKEEQELARLINEKKLADLKKKNLKLKNDIRSVKVDIGKEIEKDRVLSVSQVEVDAEGEVPGTASVRRRAPPSLNQAVGGIGVLPTLYDYGQEAEEVPSLTELRSRPELQRRIERPLEDLWNPQQHRETGSVDHSVPVTSTKLESGRTAKSESGVLRQVTWPHTRLGGRQANPNFDKLDPINLLIGEIGVVEDSKISEEERLARCSQLKKIILLTKNYGWSDIRNYHGAFLSEVERSGSWQVNTSELASELLFTVGRVQQAPAAFAPQFAAPPPPPQFPQPVNVQQAPWAQQLLQQVKPENPRGSRAFCSAWNRGQCAHTGTHRGQVGGRWKWVDHICAFCWLSHREASNHPEYQCEKAISKKGKKAEQQLPQM